MKETDAPSHSETTISLIAVHLYQWAIRKGIVYHSHAPEAARELSLDVDQVESGLKDLTRLNLLRPVPGRSAALAPSSPETAIAELVNPLEIDIKEREKRVEELRFHLLSLNPIYFESRRVRNRDEAIDTLHDLDEVRVRLGDAARRCSTEVFTAHHGVPSERTIEVCRSQDVELLARGVRMRSVYQHPVRVNPVMRGFLRQILEAGGEVRTCEELPGRIVIFDRELAFITGDVRSGAGLVLREPSVVGYFHRVLEQIWATSMPFTLETQPGFGYGDAGAELKSAIVRLLANGAKDELIARRLGISLRTCRRYVAEVMDELRASSRFQAGVLAARSGLLGEATETRDAAPWHFEASA